METRLSCFHSVKWKECEAPRPQGGASRRGSFVRIVPLDPAYKAGLAGHLPVKKREKQGFPGWEDLTGTVSLSEVRTCFMLEENQPILIDR